MKKGEKSQEKKNKTNKKQLRRNNREECEKRNDREETIDSWEDKHLFSLILDKIFALNNKRNQLKIKGIKVYSSKKSMTNCKSIENQNVYINSGLH